MPGYKYPFSGTNHRSTFPDAVKEYNYVPSSVPHHTTWEQALRQSSFESNAHHKIHSSASQHTGNERPKVLGSISEQPHFQSTSNHYMYAPMFAPPSVTNNEAYYPETSQQRGYALRPSIYMPYPPQPHWYHTYSGAPHSFSSPAHNAYLHIPSRSNSVSHSLGSLNHNTHFSSAIPVPSQEYVRTTPQAFSDPFSFKESSFPPKQSYSWYPPVPPVSKSSGSIESHDSIPGPPFDNSHMVSRDCTTEELKANVTVKETVEAFRKLIPAVKSINMFNFGELLVQILNNYDVLEPLDEFYELLFDPKHTEKKFVAENRFNTFDISQSCEFKSKGSRLSFLVLAFFKSPEDTICHIKGETIDNLMRPAVNFHEFVRTFLALRILQVFVKRVDSYKEDRPSLSRDAVYAAYCILCQKLILDNPVSASPSALIKQLVLCKSKIGKLCKLLYSDLPQRRFGKRGQSKYHMVGVVWNDAVMDPETKKMVELGITDVPGYSRSSTVQTPEKSSISFPDKDEGTNFAWNSVGSFADFQIQFNLPKQPVFSKNPTYSFVGPTIHFPEHECPPRAWLREPGRLPKHSEWAFEAIQKSAEALRVYAIDVSLLVESVSSGNFSSGQQNFMALTIDVIGRLKQLRPPSKVFLHFFLILLLLPFPSVIATDEEINASQKAELHISIDSIVFELESDSFSSSCEDEKWIRTVTKSLRSMKSLSKTASVMVQPEIFADVVQALSRNITSLQTPSGNNVDCMGELQNAFVRSMVTSMKSFDFELAPDDDPVRALEEMTNVLTSGMDSLRRSLDQMLEEFQSQSSRYTGINLACEIFFASAQIVHRVTFKHPRMLGVPMRILTFAVHHTMSQFQKLSVHEFGKLSPRIATDCFKTWYVSSAMMHEYLEALCEAIALNDRLHNDS